MAAPNYRVFDFDLATPRTRGRIVDPGTQYNSVTVLALPPAAVVSLAFGENKDLVPVLGENISFNISAPGQSPGCDVPPDEGLFIDNPAGAGQFRILVSFSGVVLS